MSRGNRSPRRGHRLKRGPDEKFVSRRITLPPLVDAAVVGLQEGEEGFSTTLARLLRSHPAVSATMEGKTMTTADLQARRDAIECAQRPLRARLARLLAEGENLSAEFVEWIQPGPAPNGFAHSAKERRLTRIGDRQNEIKAECAALRAQISALEHEQMELSRLIYQASLTGSR